MTDEQKDDQKVVDEPKGDERNYEAEARKEGWVSKEEWEAKGKDPSLHKPAKDFVEAGERIVPILKSRLTRLEKKYAALDASIASERKATLTAMQDQNEAFQAKLKEALKAAVTKGDGEAVVELQDKLGDAKEKAREIKEELKAKPEDKENPAFVSFLEENPWYSTDSDLAAEADAIGARLYKANPQRPLDDLFAEVARKVKKLNSEKFGRKPTSPDSPNRGGDGGNSKQKGVPKDVKEQFERMANLVPAADRKTFMERAIANYQANQE